MLALPASAEWRDLELCNLLVIQEPIAALLVCWRCEHQDDGRLLSCAAGQRPWRARQSLLAA